MRGGLGGTRTPDLGFRKALLYPAELRGHAGRPRACAAPDATNGDGRQPGWPGRRCEWYSATMKFNMGCGLNKKPGYVNVDAAAAAEPDEVWDLEQTPWPWPDNCAEEVLFIHSLEHMGGDPKVFLAIMTELYRILQPGGQAIIHVPHPRHDHFIGDPTHVRAIMPSTLRLFDRELNEMWRIKGHSNTPLAFYTGVDFHLAESRTMVVDEFHQQLTRGEITVQELEKIVRHQFNVAYEHQFKLVARK